MQVLKHDDRLPAFSWASDTKRCSSTPPNKALTGTPRRLTRGSCALFLSPFTLASFVCQPRRLPTPAFSPVTSPLRSLLSYAYALRSGASCRKRRPHLLTPSHSLRPDATTPTPHRTRRRPWLRTLTPLNGRSKVHVERAARLGPWRIIKRH